MPGTGGFGYMTCGYAVSFLNVTTNAPFICVDVPMYARLSTYAIMVIQYHVEKYGKLTA